ncbi:ribosome silencing factor [Cupriavidus gilardii]|uniref:ribosome silencing factor n=1 Tax=Cupriavidus gilardii TaxID=82541 RepID=UPI001ABDAAD5|nr:ribosome silencing factor [Cupriavidus gilardii]MBO4119742.1 ribosome silencing factor [Cupriavidus gilardii]
MDIRKLQRAIVDGLEDVKAQDIKVFDTSHLTELFDRVVIASGTSNRQTKALAASVRDTVKEAGGHIIAVEGMETGEWVLVDCGDAVVHILQPQLRQYYNLEEIWGDKPVRLKLGAAKGLAKASEPMDEDEDAEEKAPRRSTRRAVGERPALARLPEGMKEPSPPMGHEDTDPDAIATQRKPVARPRTTSSSGAAPARKTAARTGTGSGTGAARKTATKTAAKTATTAAKTAARTGTGTGTRTAAKTSTTRSAAAKTAAPRKRTTRSA